jgi:hypothetical protein
MWGMTPTPISPLWAVLAASALTLACSPTFNWRTTRVEGTPLQASLPCKAESAVRPVALPGGAADLSMMACEAGGLRFALGWMRVPGADADLLQAWQRASLSTVGKAPGTGTLDSWAWQVPGATLSQAVQTDGQGPRGEALVVRAVYFVQGDIAYQAAVYGQRPDRAEVAPFFEALRLP